MDISIEYDHTEITPLCELMKNYGSDKSTIPNKDKNSHNYTTYYYSLFKTIQNEPIHIFELGLGTNNVNLPSNMGADGKPGASLRGWSDFFKNGRIYGADIDKDILFNTDKITTYHCDQTSPLSIFQMWKHIPHDTLFDIILDDGLHEFNANMCFFENSFHKLKPNGVYIIEDVWIESLPLFINKLKEYQQFFNINCRIVNIPHEYNTVNNCLIAIQKV
jgi:hypothetical protein